MDCCDDRSACRRSTAVFLLVVVISLLACSPLARFRQTITTVAPICASASAVAFPIPELAPVTMQIFPCRLLFTVGMMRSFPSSLSSDLREQTHIWGSLLLLMNAAETAGTDRCTGGTRR